MYHTAIMRPALSEKARNVICNTMILLVTDLIYVKTSRFLEKIRALVEPSNKILVALVDGFSGGSGALSLRDEATPIIKGSIEQIVERIQGTGCNPIQVVALNQSALLPAIAVSSLLGLPIRSGIIRFL